MRTVLRPALTALRISRSMAVRLASDFQAAAVAAGAGRPVDLHDDVADLGGRLPVAAPQAAVLDEPAADARPDEDAERAGGLAGGPDPVFAQRAQVDVVAHHHRHLEPRLHLGGHRHAREVHVGRHGHAALVGIHHARHRDADGRQVRRPHVALGQDLFHRPPDRLQDGARLGAARRGLAVPLEHAPRLLHQAHRIFVPPTSTPRYSRDLSEFLAMVPPFYGLITPPPRGGAARQNDGRRSVRRRDRQVAPTGGRGGAFART